MSKSGEGEEGEIVKDIHGAEEAMRARRCCCSRY